MAPWLINAAGRIHQLTKLKLAIASRAFCDRKLIGDVITDELTLAADWQLYCAPMY
jgi:hypothetical protein